MAFLQQDEPALVDVAHADARRAGRRWDVIVCDPPTFSNSKRMDYVWDVQRDHGALLDDLVAVWSGTGAIWFSTNKKKFALDWQPARADLAISDQTRATTPPDFRSTPHHAFRVSGRP